MAAARVKPGAWGDADNTPGRSLSVRLEASDRLGGAAGSWIDFATGEHGDLLDLIARSRRLDAFRDVLDEAGHFLRLSPPQWVARPTQASPSPIGSPERARRLFASARPIRGTIAETYLRNRGIRGVCHLGALRFHPGCYYHAHGQARPERWPALLAAVTDRASVRQRRSWSPARESRRCCHFAPSCPRCRWWLRFSHLPALLLPPGLRRLYVARDNDAAGYRAAAALSARAQASGIEAITLTPLGDDFNSDLIASGREVLAAALRDRLAPMDVRHFLDSSISAAERCRDISGCPNQVRLCHGTHAMAFKEAVGPECA
jgi:hypothetical protein